MCCNVLHCVVVIICRSPPRRNVKQHPRDIKFIKNWKMKLNLTVVKKWNKLKNSPEFDYIEKSK